MTGWIMDVLFSWLLKKKKKIGNFIIELISNVFEKS